MGKACCVADGQMGITVRLHHTVFGGFPPHTPLHDIDAVRTTHAVDLGGACIMDLHLHGIMTIVDKSDGLAKCRLIGAGVQASDHHEALITSIGRDGSFFKVNSLHLLTNRLSFGVDHGYKFIGYTALERAMGIIRKDTEHGKHQMAVEEQFSFFDAVRNDRGGIKTAHFNEIRMILGVLLAVPAQSGIVSFDFPTVLHGSSPPMQIICISSSTQT